MRASLGSTPPPAAGTTAAKPRRKWLKITAAAVGALVVLLMVGTAVRLVTDEKYYGAKKAGKQTGQPASPESRPAVMPYPVEDGTAVEPAAGGGGETDASYSPAKQGADGVTSEEAVAPGLSGGSGSSIGRPDIVPDDSSIPPLPDKVVKSGDVQLQVHEGGVNDAYTRAMGIAREFGGYIASSSTSNQPGGSTAMVLLKVPAGRFEEAVDRLHGLGEVKSLSISGQDVSAQYVDLQARIANLEAQRDQLRTLMTQAKTVQETMAIQDRLFSVTQQIEQLKGQLQMLETKTSYGTLSLTISDIPDGTRPLPQPEGWGTREALSKAAHAFVDTLNGFIVILGPILFLAAIVGAAWLVVLWIRRLHRARIERHAYSPPPAGSPPPARPPTHQPPASPGDPAGEGSDEAGRHAA